MRVLLVSMLIAFCSVAHAFGSEAAILPQSDASKAPPRFYWQTTKAGNSAQLVTLLCSECGPSSPSATNGVPLVAVLRDTLGDDRADNDRITYVWLLSLSRDNIGQQLLAGVPFFYWRVGAGSTHVNENKPVKPLMNLTAPEQPMSVQLTREILQWTVLDPLSMPVRATTRAYTSNEVARERAHIEEAIGYLQNAPKAQTAEEGLTQAEADTVVARLALRESLLGGLVGEHQARQVGERKLAEEETVRARNWDLLRMFAEKSGLLFEPLTIAGESDRYALLWFPADDGEAEPVNSSHSAVWKALNLRNPWTDERLTSWEGPVFTRSVDENGTLLPDGVTGVRQVHLIPLGAYSLTYPKFPLLVIDFRDKLHLPRNEMTQRAITELTSGVIGISHFTNWYYYAGATLYDFIASRHGRGMDAALRLDSYAQFRSALALENNMDPELKALLQRRIESVSINPLDSSPEHELEVANAQYTALLNEAASGQLDRRLNKTREAELANWAKPPEARATGALLHAASFGLVSPRYKKDPDLLSQLNRVRRIQKDLDLLRAAANTNGRPEIAYDPIRLRAAVQEVSDLLPGVQSNYVRKDASATLQRLRALTTDSELQSDCAFGLIALDRKGSPSIAVNPKVVEGALFRPDLRK